MMKINLRSFIILLLAWTPSWADVLPLAYFPFDSSFNDASGNGHHGTLVDNGQLGNSGITTTIGSHKFGGGAMNFSDNEGDRLDIPTINMSATAAAGWSITFWARQASTPNNRGGMIVGDSSDTRDFLWIDSSPGFRFRNTAGANANIALGAENTDWHHYAVVYDNVSGGTGTVTLYRNTLPVGSPVTNFAGSLTINAIGQGYNTANYGFHGQIDELYIFAEAISSAKIAELYAGEPDNTPPTLFPENMVDDRNGAPVVVNSPVLYELSFSKDMDADTVGASVFGNLGDANITIGDITKISPGVFRVSVTPTSIGVLQLAILQGAVLTDLSGIPLDTTSTIADATLIDVLESLPPSPLKRIRVFLVGGQSNADGRAASSGLPTSPVNLQQPQDDVDIYYRARNRTPELTTLRPGLTQNSSHFGPEVTFGRRLADALADGVTSRVALIKYANGGTNLHTQWKAGGDATTTGDGTEYRVFQQTVTAGLAALGAAYPGTAIEIEGMLWVQGESDASQAENYETNLTNFISDIRATYGAHLWFVVSRLSSLQTNINATSLATIRAAQSAVALADPLTALLNTDSFGISGDNLHFNALGFQQIGIGAAGLLLNFRPFTSQPAITPQAGSSLKIDVPDVFPGFLYTLRSSATLQPASWEFEESIIAGSTAIEFIHSPNPLELRRFYRVERTIAP